MSEAVRAFIALPVTEAARTPLLEAQDAMRRKAERTGLSPRWTKPEQMHITLKFFGDVAPRKLPEVTELMRWYAARTLAIDTHFTGIIAFGGPRRAGVLVAAVADEDGLVAELAQGIEKDAAPLGFEPERRAFRPHVTLARVKARRNVAALLEAGQLDRAPVRFGEARLYESRLTPEGGVYSVLAAEPLAR